MNRDFQHTLWAELSEQEADESMDYLDYLQDDPFQITVSFIHSKSATFRGF